MKTAEKKRAVLSEINVTPFVDVMLVLLIIFMVTAPMLKQGVSLSLPKTRPTGARLSGDLLILQITKDKEVYLGSESIPLSGLSRKLKLLVESKPNRGIYIQADKSLPYGFVARILADLQAEGVTQINLVTATK